MCFLDDICIAFSDLASERTEVKAKPKQRLSRKRTSDAHDSLKTSAKRRSSRKKSAEQQACDSESMIPDVPFCQQSPTAPHSSEPAPNFDSTIQEEHVVKDVGDDVTLHVAGDSIREHETSDCKDNIKTSLQELFGHEDFKAGQQEALERVLSGKSTLFISATGGGKSLCYQLPAYKLDGTTLVVSPLLSLIQDQMEHLPDSIRGATLNSQQSQEEYQSVVQRLRNGEVDVLFVAPERLFTDAFLAVARGLPPFPLVCIDEVHCISEWAHNFRPSYLRLRPLLRDVLHARCILGLTATATKSMEREIISALGIELEGIIRSDILRPNLRLTVSRDKNRQLSTLDLLQKDPRFKKGSVIVYCSLRAQCEDLAKYLRGHSVSADYYHAGRTPKDRQLIQNRFFSGKVRVVVATVAFGMGLDKSNIRGIIHYSCPQSIEGYVQEIGRAGRDGDVAYCHLFMNEEDQARMLSLAHGEGIELCNVKRFVDYVLLGPINVDDSKHNSRDAGAFVQVDEDAEIQYDIPKESMETILCFLEQEQLVEVCNPSASRGTISFLTPQRRELEQSSRVVAAILSLSSPRNGQWTFVPSDIANHVHLKIADVTRELRNLKSQRLIRVEWTGRSFTCRILPGQSDVCKAAEDASEVIHQRFSALERRRLARLHSLQSMLDRVAQDSWINANEEVKLPSASDQDSEMTDGQCHAGHLASMISDYFAKETDLQDDGIHIVDTSDFRKADKSDVSSSKGEAAVSGPTDRFLRADLINLIHSIKSDNPLLTG